MDSHRAKQIMDSYGVIEVLYNGAPVWIENIHGDSAEVTQIDTNKKMDVSINKLVENDIKTI